LAELAAPSEAAAKLTTSFVVATSTLAPLAVFVSKALRKDSEEHNILKDLKPDWYPAIILTAVILCTLVAIASALALGRIDNSNSSETAKNRLGPLRQTGLLSASMLLFGVYTFLVNDWKPASIEVNLNVNTVDLVLPAFGFAGLIIIFFSAPLLIGPSVRSFSKDYRKTPVAAFTVLQSAFRSIGRPILALLTIAVLVGLLLKNNWIRDGSAGWAGSLPNVPNVSADDLAQYLFVFAGIIAFFPILAIAIIGARQIRRGTSAILERFWPSPPAPVVRIQEAPAISDKPANARPSGPFRPEREPGGSAENKPSPRITVGQILPWLVATIVGLWVLATYVYPLGSFEQSIWSYPVSHIIAVILIVIYGVALTAFPIRLGGWMVVVYGLASLLLCGHYLWEHNWGPAIYAGAFCIFTVSFARGRRDLGRE
jgi:hypothetical protein